jgi:hypothetical protein
MSQNIDEIRARYERELREMEESKIASTIMDSAGSLAQKLSLLKMLSAMGHSALPGVANATSSPIMQHMGAVGMGATALRDLATGYKTQQQNQANIKTIATLRSRVGYQNSGGDIAALSNMGLINIGKSIGTTGAAIKAAGALGYMPDILHDVSPLTLMGAMSGGKGLGMFSAGMMGGAGNIGSLLGAGTKGALLGSMPPALMGIMTMMALNMAGGKLSKMMDAAGSYNIKRFTANTNMQLHNGMQLEIQHSNMIQIQGQLRLLQGLGQLTPAEALMVNVLMLIESHTSVLAPMAEEVINAREYKDVGGANSGQNVASEKFGEDGYAAIYNQKGTRRAPNMLQKAAQSFAQFGQNLKSVVSIGDQIGNTLSGKSSVELFNRANRKRHEMDAKQEFSEKFSISVAFTDLLHTSAAQVLQSSDSYYSKSISLAAGMYEGIRYLGHELLSIRKDGFGIARPGHAGDLLKRTLQEEDHPDMPFESLWQGLDEMLGYIPGWHTLSGGFKMGRKGIKNIHNAWKGVDSDGNPTDSFWNRAKKELKNYMASTYSNPEQDEGTLRTAIGANRLSKSDLMSSYLSGDFVNQVTKLVNYNAEQAHYLKFLAEMESKRQRRGNKLGVFQADEDRTMDEFSGKLMTADEIRARNKTIKDKLRRELGQTLPNSTMGMIFEQLAGRRAVSRSREYAYNNFNHIRDLVNEFDPLMAHMASGGRGFNDGGDTGKAKPGTKPDSSGEKPVGVVHEDEHVIPKWQVSKFPEMVSFLEADRRNHLGLAGGNETDLQKAQAQEQKDAQAKAFINEEAQTEELKKNNTAQTEQIRWLARIASFLDPKTKKERGDDNFLTSMPLMLGAFGLAAALSKMNDKYKSLTDMVRGHLAVSGMILAAVVGKTASFLVNKIPGLKNFGGSIMDMVNARHIKEATLKAEADKTKEHLKGKMDAINSAQDHLDRVNATEAKSKAAKEAKQQAIFDANVQLNEAKAKMSEAASAHGENVKKLEEHKEKGNWFKQVRTNTKATLKEAGRAAGRAAVSANSYLGGKVAGMGKAGLLALGGDAVLGYLMEPDTDPKTGKDRSFLDKIKSVSGNLIKDAGSILGGAAGFAIGGYPGMMVGSMIGKLAQDKFQDWFKQFETNSDGSEATTWEAISNMVKNNLGITIGAGVGGILGTYLLPGLGSVLGAGIGGILGNYAEAGIVKISKAISNFDFKGAAKKTGGWLKENMPGVKEGMKVSSMIFGEDSIIGMLIGGILGSVIFGPFLSLGKVITYMGEQISSTIKDAAGLGTGQTNTDAVVSGKRIDQFTAQFGKGDFKSILHLRETGTANADYGNIRYNESGDDKGTLNAIGAYQFDRKAGVAGQVLDKILADKSIQNDSFYIQHKSLIDDAVDAAKNGKVLSNSQRAWLKQLLNMKGVGKIQEDFWEQNYFSNMPASLKNFVTSNQSDKKIKSLQQYLTSEYNYMNGVTGPWYKKASADGKITRAEINDLRAQLKKHVPFKSHYSSGDLDAALDKIISNTILNLTGSYIEGGVTAQAKATDDAIKTTTSTIDSLVTSISGNGSGTSATDTTSSGVDKVKKAVVDSHKQVKAQHEETMAQLKTHNEQLKASNQLLEQSNAVALAAANTANQGLNVLAQQLEQIKNNQKNSETLWDYIEKVYSYPKFKDVQFAPLYTKH